METMKTLTTEHPTYERNYVSSHAGEKTLNENVKVAIGQRSYKCEICSKQFTHASSLKTHSRIHTGDKPYKCETCLKQFITAGYLQNENKMEIEETSTTEHSSYERNYVSPQAEEKTLNQNMKVEIGQRSYKCELCFKQFITPTHSEKQQEASGMGSVLYKNSGPANQ
ncbi:zinc finger protein 626-like [Diabrotica virgifera virgifera]|uniref:C2H2-type domain-containing protein n=1 Tax=Diabrotica virgifera virgifera TaxID=50390 RepID=A0ABM5L114_DIAVI|nr:zinc finger protein 626-like [Diabrotica virgifera virgifera]